MKNVDLLIKLENNKSKARLMLLIDELLNSNKIEGNLSYFPSYEIVVDELRDYRFFKEDGLEIEK